jgi:hypothetical protein
MTNEAFNIIQSYAHKNGYDSIRPAGEKGGYKYFRTFSAADQGHKTGLPHIVKISAVGKIIEVTLLSEIMWAVRQEVALMK